MRSYFSSHVEMRPGARTDYPEKARERESTYLILLTCPRNNTAIFHIKIAFAAGRKMMVRGARQLPGEIHFDRFHTLN